MGMYEYDAFGSVRAHSGLETEWTYTGEQNDPNGLLYLRARYYDPVIGRFLTRDPFRGFLFTPQSLNQYVYVRNNPVNWIDPWGLCDVEGSALATPTPTHTPTPTPARRVWACGPAKQAECLNGHFVVLRTCWQAHPLHAPLYLGYRFAEQVLPPVWDVLASRSPECYGHGSPASLLGVLGVGEYYTGNVWAVTATLQLFQIETTAAANACLQ
jgi:RHS repeat-associated protein